MKNNDEIEFTVEEGTVDTDDLRTEDYNKFRELYKLIAEINQLPGNSFHPRKMEALKELMDNKLYSDAVKSPFFIDKLADSIEEGGFYYEMACTIEVDLKSYLKGDDPKYSRLKKALLDQHIYHDYHEPQGITLKYKKRYFFCRVIVAVILAVVSILLLLAAIRIIIQNLEGAAALGITPILIAANPASDVETSFMKIHSLSELL